MCQCTLDSGDCVHVYGTGTTDDPYRFEPIISSAAGNLIECGPNGLGAFLLPIYVDPPAVHAYATIEQVIAYDTVQALEFNENRYNTDNMLDEDDLGIIRFNTPGLYLVTFNARWKKTNDNDATGDMAAFIMRNGAQYLVIDSYPVPGGDSFAKHSISILYPFEAGDFASALLKQDVIDSDDDPMNLTATVHRMSPIFTAMYMRPLEGMNILGVPASSPTLSEGGSGIGTEYALDGAHWWQTNDHASLDIVGDFDIRAAIKATDATPAIAGSLVTKWNTTLNQRAYGLVATTGAELQGKRSSTGADTGNSISNNVDLADGVIKAVRWTHAVGTGADLMYTKTTTAATALDDIESNSGWTLTDTLGGGTGAIFSSSAALSVGAENVESTPAQFFIGDIYAVVVKDGINGTTVANPDFYHNNSPFTDSSGRTWIKFP